MTMGKYIAAVKAAETISEKTGIPLSDLVDIFAEIQAADAAPVVHARWEEYLIPNILCYSNCDWGIDPLCKSPYCPNCGAKMDMKDGGDNDAVD